MENLDTNRTIDATLKVVGEVLLRSFIIGFALLLLSGISLLFVSGLMGDITESLFGIEPEVFASINLLSIALFKMCLFTFFLFPYIAIQWTLSRRNRSA
ncbi:MAG: hypothetical protein VCD00_07430 [Candidatus Hydrogenedentota bacterium]